MKTIILVICIVLVAAGAVIFFFNDIFPSSEKIDDNIDHYLRSDLGLMDHYAANILPLLNSLPEYENISYRYYIDRRYYATESMLLVVTYDEQTFNAEKERLESAFTYLDRVEYYKDAEGNDVPDCFLIPEYEFSVNSFDFRVVNGGDYTNYPKYFGMIASSEEKRSIAYLYFFDEQLYFISSPEIKQSMEQFTERYFPYEW